MSRTLPVSCSQDLCAGYTMAHKGIQWHTATEMFLTPIVLSPGLSADLSNASHTCREENIFAALF